MTESSPLPVPPDVKFLGIRLRAFAQATEVEDRVLKAMAFASGTEDISIARTTGHFGNSIAVFEAELLRSGDMKRFLGRLLDAGIPAKLIGQADSRTDEDCVFHFRLDKQRAYRGELALATGRDVIDVRMKVGAYPARRASAVSAISGWLDASRSPGP